MPPILDREDKFEGFKKSIKVDDKRRVMLEREYSSKNYRVSKSTTGELL